MNKKIVLFLFCLITYLNAQELIMGYRETPRLPLIDGIDNNSGIYYDIFSEAAKRNNLTLKVIRLPKKRILQLLKSGDIDFYPGFTFTKVRAEYTYYFKNGLEDGGDVGLSLKNFPLISNLEQLKDKKVLTAFGGPREDILKGIDGINLYSVPRLSLEKAITLLQKKRYDFYIYNKSTIKYYLKKKNITNMMVHPNCCGGEQPMYLGFSKKSKFYKEEKNPLYNQEKALSIDNVPMKLSKKSLAYQLMLTLEEMKQSGEIQQIVDKYYQ